MRKIYNPTNSSSIDTVFDSKKLALGCGDTAEFSDDETEFLFKAYSWLIEINNFVPTNFRSDDVKTIEKFKEGWAKFGNDIGLLRNKKSNKFIIIGDKRYEIPNPETRDALGYDISDFPQDEKYLDSLSPGKNVTNVVKARLIRDKNDPDPVYIIFISPRHEKKHIPDEKTLFAMRRKQEEIEYLSSKEFNEIPEGEELRFVDKWDISKIHHAQKKQSDDRNEIIKLSPEFYGVGIDLKKLWKKIRANKTKNKRLKKSENTFMANKKKVKRNRFNHPWLIAIVMIIVTIGIAYYFYAKEKKERLEELPNDIIASKSVESSENLRLVDSLEIEKSLSLLPDKIYGYVHYLSIVFAVKDKKIEDLDFDSSRLDIFDWSWMFEIQKISNREIYVIGYINDENFSKIGDIERTKNTEIMVFPSAHKQFKNPVAILLQSIISIKGRCVEIEHDNDFILPSSICILEIKAESILDRFEKHDG